MQTATSSADLVKQINTKAKSTASLNSDNSATVNGVTTSGVPVTHSRVIVDSGRQTVTIGDGSGVRTTTVDQFLNSLQ